MNVMTKAWEIAKQGQKKFGGNVKEYFAESLKLAWALIKKGVKKMIKLPKIVEMHAEKLISGKFKREGSQGKVWAKNEAKHEYDELINNYKKMNKYRKEKGIKTIDIEDFKNKLDELTLNEYVKVRLQASHVAKKLK